MKKSDIVQGVLDKIMSLDSDSQVELLKLWLGDTENTALKRTLLNVALKILNRKRNMKDIDIWMDSRLKKNPDITPMRMANEYIYYKKLSTEMMPYALKRARLAKLRVAVRKLRAERNANAHLNSSLTDKNKETGLENQDITGNVFAVTPSKESSSPALLTACYGN